MPADEILALTKYRDTVDKGHIARQTVGLFAVGYLLLIVILPLAGFQSFGFYLEPSVLVALVVSTTSAVTLTAHRMLASYLGN